MLYLKRFFLITRILKLKFYCYHIYFSHFENPSKQRYCPSLRTLVYNFEMWKLSRFYTPTCTMKGIINIPKNNSLTIWTGKEIKGGIMTLSYVLCWISFDQGSISPSFYKQLFRPQSPAEPKKNKKDSQLMQLFALLGSARVKAAPKHVDEIDPRRQSYKIV